MLTNGDLINGRMGHAMWTAVQKRESINKMISVSGMTLTAEEARTFIEWMWDLSAMKRFARIIPMTTAKKKIRGLGWGDNDFLYPEAEFDQTKVTESFADHEIELSTKEFRGAILIKDADLEDINVGSANQFKAHLMSMVAKRLARELELICWLGDTAGLSGFASDDSKSKVDGWRYWFDHSQTGETYVNGVTGSTTILDASNTVTALAASYSLTTSQGIVETDASAPYAQEIKYGLMKKKLPPEYKSDGLGNLRFLNNDELLDDYTMALEARGTALGDVAIMGQNFTTYGAIPIMPCPLMPVTMKIDTVDVQKEAYVPASGDLTDCLLTVNGNMVVGLQLDMVMEAERSAADRGTYFYFTTRFDTAVSDVAAAVLNKRLKVL